MREHLFGILQRHSSMISAWYGDLTNTQLASDSFDLGRRDRSVGSTFRCPTCEKMFYSKKNLERHSLIHLGIRPFVCTLCEKRFNQKSAGLRHVANVHQNHDPKSNIITDPSFIRGYAIINDSDRV